MDSQGIPREQVLLRITRACVETNQRLLSETRYRLAANRRRLNRSFALAGGCEQHEALLASIRARLESGDLSSSVPGKVLAGYGSEHVCIVCREPIACRDVEYEVRLDDSDLIFSHMHWYSVWRAEACCEKN